MAMKFVVACQKFFGKRQEQTLSQLLEEVRQLTPKDREEMKPELEKALGVEIEV